MNIVFGTKKLGAQIAKSSEKYPNFAIVTVEGVKGAKKSRRILFNRKAAELLDLAEGELQQVVFASVETGVDTERQVLIANVATISGAADEMVTYKTSKNKVSYGEDTSERGKAVTSSHMCNEIFSFLGHDDSANVEFALSTFPGDSVEAYSLDLFNGIDELSTPASALESDVQAEIIETNNGGMTAEELTDSVQDQVAQDEANDSIFNEEPKTQEESVVATVNDWA